MNRFQTWTGLLTALGAAFTAFCISLSGHPDVLPQHTLVYVAAFGAALSAFGQSLTPRNGTRTRATDLQPLPGSPIATNQTKGPPSQQ